MSSTSRNAYPAKGRNEVIQEELDAPQHIHGHRNKGQRFSPNPEETRPNSNVYHNDEAFARYEMGEPNAHRASEERGARTKDNALNMNHKVRGVKKEKALESMREDEMEPLKPGDIPHMKGTAPSATY